MNSLSQHNIYIVDLSRYYAKAPRGKYYLVYAPLKGAFFIADNISPDAIPQHLLSPDNDALMRPHVSHPSQFSKLSILPNLTCNFKCAYCYSAKGRSRSVISEEHITTMLDYFVDGARIADRELAIFISGGGEPTLTWDKVVFAVNYAEQRAQSQGKTLNIMLMSNGSLIDDTIANFIKQHGINIGISFDILPEVQNSQRGKYDLVAANIKRLLSIGVIPSVSAVITPDNVCLMTQMVQEIVNNFSGIKHLNFDPAVSDELFASEAELRAFYHSFADNFFNARALSGQHNITLDCNAIRHAQKIFPRYCEGKLCLVPNGDISMCHTVSSPKETHYNDFTYGDVHDGMVKFDMAVFSRLVNSDNYLMDRCHDCIARWHCAGGCMMCRLNYNADKMSAVCDFTADMTTRLLLHRLDEAMRRKYNKSIEEML